ncbi:hypothetical protein [Pandoraea terrigena]|uniref:hypothetical protein n=1 Tax=Pandoraea terrigena TaxID=2508292 RepID=UPI001582BFE7|nr:hypothetical protein [Pandoraea terrigena]
MANKSLGTRQKLMFRGTAGVGGRVGGRHTGGRPPPPAPGAPGGTGRRPGSVGGGGGAVNPLTGGKQRRA